MRNYLAAVKIMREEGMITENVAVELEGKAHDEEGEMPFWGALIVAFVSHVMQILAPAESQN